MSMKNSNDTIENRACDYPACSTVPQPTAPPRTTIVGVKSLINERSFAILDQCKLHPIWKSNRTTQMPFHGRLNVLK
jgi:hypothetical protein